MATDQEPRPWRPLPTAPRLTLQHARYVELTPRHEQAALAALADLLAPLAEVSVDGGAAEEAST